MTPSFVLASLRGSTYRSVRLASSLAEVLPDSLFEHPASLAFLRHAADLSEPMRNLSRSSRESFLALCSTLYEAEYHTPVDSEGLVNLLCECI